MKRWVLGVVGALAVSISGAAYADSVTITTSFDCVGAYACEQQVTHTDAAPFKGSVDITLTNSGTQAWGDFHFFIFQAGLETVENVDFDVTTAAPTSSQSGLSWAVDNVAVGATLDLYFYSDPILAGETATFHFLTDNTVDQVSFFGLGFYPTPVPEPGSVVLLGLGAVSLAGSRRVARARQH